MNTNDFSQSKIDGYSGRCGRIIMLVSSTLFMQFNVPARWTAFVLSFLLGLVAFRYVAIPLWQRGIYYFLNALIVFCVAVGTNTVGSNVDAARNEIDRPKIHHREGPKIRPGDTGARKRPLFQPWFQRDSD
jgi:hypothetical protein